MLDMDVLTKIVNINRLKGKAFVNVNIFWILLIGGFLIYFILHNINYNLKM